ncbi:hypothetical protein KJ953_03615 [Patescibacteria group bacterium]|nr:hypothetical protein [Patescibacteria group bacterium]
MAPRNVLIYLPDKGVLQRAGDMGLSRTNETLHKVKLLFGESPLLPFVYKLYVKLTEGLSTDKALIDPDNLPGDFRVIHGHYDLETFKNKMVDPFLTVVLREPLERMISQYIHWRRNAGSRAWRVNLPFDSNLSFEDYAMNVGFRNYQSRALSGVDLGEFDVVGVTEYLNLFLKQMESGCGESVKRLNQSPTKTSLKELGVLDEVNFTKKFKEYHWKDYENYELAKELVCRGIE